MQMVDRALDKRAAVLLFLIGMFSMTQIRLGPKIGISEAVCCIIGPFLFLKNISLFRRDGVMPFFLLLIFWMGGALFSDYLNQGYSYQLIRGASVPITLFCVSVCIYLLLRRNPLNLKWIIIGIALSSVLSIFVFQRGSAGDLAAEGQTAAAVERVVGYKLFWTDQVKTWLSLPIQCWYQSMPPAFMLLAIVGIAVSNAMAGGRSLFAVTLLSLLFVLVGGKTERTITRLKRHIPLMVAGLFLLMLLVKALYSYAATHGLLSEEETLKYESQTAHGSGIMALLKSGRADFFIGLDAALDRPIVGHGSQALDTKGYEREFVFEYGSDIERKNYLCAEAKGYLRTIRAHSHIICYWMWHGVFALLFWIYVFCLLLQTIRKRLSLIPEWFGYFALTLPAFAWDYFFSPLGLRVNECVLYTSMLILVRLERLRIRGGVFKCG